MVVIDIKMPKNCVECNNMGLRYSLSCELICSGCANCGRHPNCPLVEIVTCKNCDHCRFESVEGIPYYWCDKDDRVTSEDYYCADAERRE